MKVVDSNRLLRGFAWARLGVAALLLMLGPALPGDLLPGTNRGILALTLLAVVVTSSALLLFDPLQRPRSISWLICLLDTVLVTAVVASTGASRSIFTFLYVLSVTAACVLLSRTGGLAIAGAASALYIGLVFGRTIFPMTGLFEASHETTSLEIVTMFLNSGTFVVVAFAAGGLAERFQSTHAELETQRRDLRDLQALKDLVFESVGSGLIAIDRRHVVTAFNHAAEEMSGLAASHAIGRPWTALFGEEVDLGAVERAVEARGRDSRQYEMAMRRPDGSATPVRVTLSALRAGDGSRAGLIAMCEDLSTIRQMEARVRQADRLATLGRMAANIAHEIRNPLAALTGAIEVLAADGAPPETRGRLANIVLKESGRLNGIIKQFLEYARPAVLARARVNVADALDEVLVLLDHRAGPGALKLVREFPTSLIWDVDPQQFRQALWNLCLNAFEAMPGGGELRVGAEVTDGTLVVRVTDTGEGVAPEDAAHIFEPFYSTKTSGTGLGLAMVQRIAQDHGGRVDVQSEPGGGSTFSISVPAHHG
jgi:two-component system sensor histidine kinase PilS (NtrC family)